jgi:hypothetical protein
VGQPPLLRGNCEVDRPGSYAVPAVEAGARGGMVSDVTTASRSASPPGPPVSQGSRS